MGPPSRICFLIHLKESSAESKSFLRTSRSCSQAARSSFDFTEDARARSWSIRLSMESRLSSTRLCSLSRLDLGIPFSPWEGLLLRSLSPLGTEDGRECSGAEAPIGSPLPGFSIGKTSGYSPSPPPLQTCPRQPGGCSVSAFGGGSAWSLGFPFPQPIRLCQPGLTFCYKLAGQRWIEGKIDLSSSGTGPSIDHRAYSTLTEFILLKRKKSFSCCISLVWKFQNVVCGFITKESPLMLCHLIN